MQGSDIRTFFRELFGSRIVENLELQLLHLRQDFEQRLQDKDQVIAEVRAEKAIMQGRMSIYENTIMPLASRAGAQVVAAANPAIPKKPNFSATDIIASLPKSRWEIEQARHYAAHAKADAAQAEEKEVSGTPADRS